MEYKEGETLEGFRGRHPDARPGDYIISKYMPNCTPEEREEARNNLKACVAFLVKIQQQIEREEQTKKQDG